MASRNVQDDPLRFGADEEDMEDLTAQLDKELGQQDQQDSHDEIDLGDSSALHGANPLDRYKALGAEDPATGTAFPTYDQLVTPPSYEDSIMYDTAPSSSRHQQAQAQYPLASEPIQQVAQSPGTSAGGTLEREPSSEQAEAPFSPHLPRRQHHQGMVITVTDPVKRESSGLFGLKAGYVTYSVTTKPTQPEFGADQTQVRRRFRDFVALADVLKGRYRGHFLPPRPEKSVVEGQRSTEAFVEERRTALERYMNKLARHPVVARSEELRAFLQLPGELEGNPAWTALAPLSRGNLMDGTAKLSKQLFGLERGVVDPVQAAQPTRKTADIMRAVKEATHSVALSSLSDEELGLRRSREQLEALRDQLVAATREAEKLVHKMERRSAVEGELGLALVKMAKFEEVEGKSLAQYTGTIKQWQALLGQTKRCGASLVRVSRVNRMATGKSAEQLSTLHDYLAMAPSAVKGLKQREKQLLTHHTLESDLAGRHKAIGDLEVAGAKVFGGDQAKVKKVAELKNDVSKLELSIQAARAEYERIRGTNQEELGRWRKELQADWQHMVNGFTQVQLLSSQRDLEVWLQLAGELGATREELQAVKAGVVNTQ